MASLWPPLSLTLLLLLASASAVSSDQGSDIRILQLKNPSVTSSSWEETIANLISLDNSRLQYLVSLAAPKRSFVPLAPGRQLLQIPNYVVRASLGSPAQPMLSALDTSRDTAWFPCAACVGCPASSPSFAQAQSSTFRSVPCGSLQCSQVPNPYCFPFSTSCSFNLTYGSSSILANLAQDSLALSTDVITSFTFGCLQKVTGMSVPPQGLLGLGRGTLSFLSQTKDLYQSTFSYCLPSFKSFNFSGTLRLGPVGQPKRIKTTALLSNSRRSSLYYVNMVGIRVGRKVVDIPRDALAFNSVTGAGTIVDSGTMFTRLVEPAYLAVRDEVRRRVKGGGPATSLGGFDTCYNGQFKSPSVTFMFTGMNVTLPMDNIWIHSTAGTISCLAMAAAPPMSSGNVDSVLNVIANMQQQNHRVLFDVPNGRIGFARERCT